MRPGPYLGPVLLGCRADSQRFRLQLLRSVCRRSLFPPGSPEREHRPWWRTRHGRQQWSVAITTPRRHSIRAPAFVVEQFCEFWSAGGDDRDSAGTARAKPIEARRIYTPRW